MREQRCPVCNRPAEVGWWQNHAGFEIRCEYCGSYRIGLPTFKWMRAEWDRNNADWLWPYLSAAIRQAPEPPMLTLDNWHALAREVHARPPETKVEKLLALLKRRSAHRGQPVAFEESDYPLVDVINDQEAVYLVQLLQEEGLIKGTHPLYSVTPRGWEYKSARQAAAVPGKVFLSHAAVDGSLAAAVCAEIQKRVPDIEIFVASQPGHIRTGEKWLDAIEQKLRTGDTYVILLTPASVERPWVWFETGSVWFSDKRISPVLVAGLDANDVPPPLSARQMLNLDQVAGVQQFLRDFGVDVAEPEAGEIVARIRAAATVASDSWKTLIYEDRRFVWDGPVATLLDRSAVIATKHLMDSIEAHGFKSRCARPDAIGRHMEKGYRQIFESDLKTWKRPMMCAAIPQHLWMIRPADLKQEE
jgi:hypothetical protein